MEGGAFGRVGLRRGRLQLGEQQSQRDPLPIVLRVDGRVVRAADELGQELRADGRRPVADGRQARPEARPGNGTSETEV